LNGLLKGVIGAPGGTVPPNTPLRFDVTVVDSRGTNPNKLTEKFRITLVDPNIFKFAQSSLNSGVQFRRYFEKLEVIAGHSNSYNFTASNIAVTNGATVTPIAKFEDLGLFLNKKTGRLVGRPLLSGVVSFLADCTDDTGSHALSRDRTKTGQVITFIVIDNNRVSSELFSTKMSIKGDTKGGNKDSIQYAGLLDLAGKQVSDLNGLGVTLTIGEYTSPTVTLTGGKGSTVGPPSMTVSINSDGSIKVAIQKDSFGQAMSIITNGELANNNKILAVTLTIQDPGSSSKPLYQNPELLRFTVKARSSKFDLEYKFGPGNLGGGFIITQVMGKDDKAETGDAWRVSFLTLPPNSKKLADLGNVSSANVGIGTDFFNSINVTLNNDSVRSTEKRDPKSAQVVKFSYNDKSGKGQVTTGLLPFISNLPNTQTNIPPALNANGKKSPFPFIYTLTDANSKEILGAEGSRKIIPKGNQYVSKDLAH
jgi:hypothetical protein